MASTMTHYMTLEARTHRTKAGMNLDICVIFVGKCVTELPKSERKK